MCFELDGLLHQVTNFNLSKVSYLFFSVTGKYYNKDFDHVYKNILIILKVYSKYLYIIILFFISPIKVLSQVEHFIPKGHCDEPIDYTYYSICYDKVHRQALWVKYELT